MTTYEDNLLAARFAALAPEPLAGDWADVVARAGAARKGQTLLPRSRLLSRRRRLVVVLAVIAVVAVGTASAIGSVRDFILDRGFIGLPPVGATPSSPESSDLVVQLFAFSPPLSPQQDGTDMVRAWVYADGRIIWDRRPHDLKGRGIPEGANEFNSGYLEQRLAPEGVELVRAAAAELLERSRTLLEEIPAVEDPWWGRDHGPRLALLVPKDFGSEWGVLAVPHGDESARLYWSRETNDSVRSTAATPEQLSALGRVHALLTDPASVLPSSAWAEQKVRAYVPSHYAVCIDTSPPRDASELLSLLPARAADLLRDKSRTRRGWEPYGSLYPDGPMGVLGQAVTDCYKVETEHARAVADALSGLEPAPGLGTHWLAYGVAKGVKWWEGTTISFEPYFPDGRIPFSAAFG